MAPWGQYSERGLATASHDNLQKLTGTDRQTYRRTERRADRKDHVLSQATALTKKCDTFLGFVRDKINSCFHSLLLFVIFLSDLSFFHLTNRGAPATRYMWIWITCLHVSYTLLGKMWNKVNYRVFATLLHQQRLGTGILNLIHRATPTESQLINRLIF